MRLRRVVCCRLYTAASLNDVKTIKYCLEVCDKTAGGTVVVPGVKLVVAAVGC